MPPSKKPQARKRKPAEPPVPERRPSGNKSPRRREIGAFLCLIAAIFTFLGYADTTGWLIQGLRAGISGLIGWGFYAVPLVLLVIVFILAFHRGRPVRLRVVCATLLPVLLGAFLHLFLASSLSETDGMLAELWRSGQEMRTGGVVSGLLAIGLENMVSIVGAVAVLLFCFGFAILATCNKSIVDLVDWFKNRERRAYEPELEYEEERSAPSMEAPAPRRRGAIDIPLDGETPPKRGRSKKQAETEAGRKPFKLHDPNVAPPDPLVNTEKPVEAPRLRKRAPFDIPLEGDQIPNVEYTNDVPDLTPYQKRKQAAEPASDMPPVAAETGTEKAKPQEVAQAKTEIAAAIAQKQDETHDDYEFPPINLLKKGKKSTVDGRQEIEENAQRLDSALESFGIEANIVNVTRGPSVTRYELELEAGIKLNKLTNLADDLALSLGATSVRIAPIPDKISTVGIEVPNKNVSLVSLREVIASDNFEKPTGKLTFALGKDINGTCMVGNIAKLPHLLIAGTTGSGKSVTMNSLIISVLYKASPDEVKFIMIDPKMVEFGAYNGIPHLLIPVVTDPKKAAGALQWGVTEMLKRYKLFSESGARDLETYNRYAKESEEDLQVFPQLVIVIDELADLMMIAKTEVEESICRIAQMGRAAGVHLVVATQRPSADVITGLMKANIPSRIALSVASSMESRIIMDTMGAEKLVGNGDMLYKPIGVNKPTRIQGTFVSDEERDQVIAFLKEHGTAQYDDTVGNFIESASSDEKNEGSSGNGGANSDYDEMFGDAVNVVLDLGQASTSVLQRKLKLGYSRAARLIDQLEEAGIVGQFEGSKPRQVLISRAQWQAMQEGGAPTAMDDSFDDIPKDDFSDLENETEE